MSNEQKFKIALSKEALKHHNKVSTDTAERLDKCFVNLELESIKGAKNKPLKAMADKYRYRVGNLRIIYEVDLLKRVVNGLAILPRGQVYK